MQLSSVTDILHANWESFQYFQPELVLIAGFLITIIAGLIWKHHGVLFHSLALVTLGAVGVLEIIYLNSPTKIIFSESFRTGNTFGDYLKMLFCLSALLTVAMTWRNKNMKERLSEYYALILSVVLGANLLVMAENWLILFLSLEIISISSYVLTTFLFEKKSFEGGLKYFLFGSVASAAMVYGISIFYGVFGTIEFTHLQPPAIQSLPLFYLSGVLVFAGFLFKVAAAPFHPWAPDVYESAPMPIVAFFSVVPKLAGVGILLKFVAYFQTTGWNQQLIVAGVAILTLTVGNFSALWQKDVKRLMAYSSIGQSGFMLVAIAALSIQSAQALYFYSFVYVALTFSVFFYLQYFENAGATTIAAFVGSAKTFVWPSIIMLISFVGLTGLPPTAGFTGKLFLFSALWQTYASSGQPVMLWLLVFGLLNTVVYLF